MKVTVRQYRGQIQIFEDFDGSTSVGDFIKIIRNKFGISDEFNQIKLIYLGKVMEPDKTVEYHTKTNLNPTIILFVRQTEEAPAKQTQQFTPSSTIPPQTQPIQNLQPPTAPQQVPQQIPVNIGGTNLFQNLQPPSIPQQVPVNISGANLFQQLQQLFAPLAPQPIPTEPTYSVDQVHAIFPALMLFIRNNPVLFQAMTDQPNMMVSMLIQPVIRDFVANLLTQSDQILHAMETSGTYIAEAPVLGYTNNQPDSVTSDNPNINNTNSMPEPVENDSSGVPVNPMASITLNAEDEANISMLADMGFPRPFAARAYILAKKNLDLAASILFDGTEFN